MRACAALALALSCACAHEVEPAPWLAEVARERGLVFLHESGHAGAHYMPEIMSGGAALFDMDQDGDLDAYLVQAGPVEAAPEERAPNRLFENQGGAFVDVTAHSGAGDRGCGMGVACADVEGDGDVDLYVTNLGPNALLVNEGSGRFRDERERSGTGHGGWGTSAAFFDQDHDGFLELYVCNYLSWSARGELPCKNAAGASDYCSPLTYAAPALDVLYRNRGDGTFEDASERSGVASEIATGLGVVASDFDGDGLVDLFVANDGMPNFLWRNGGDGRFANVGLLAGCALDKDGVPKAGMGVAAEDVDGDGDPDLLVGNLARESDSYFENRGGRFVERTTSAGLAVASKPFTRFGLALVDLDNDGWLDLYQANGRVTAHSRPWANDLYAEPNLLLRGARGPLFEEVLPRGGTRALLVATSRAAAFGDVDGDGGVDVLVVNKDGPAHLLVDVAPRGHWLRLRLDDPTGRTTLNARVELQAGLLRLVRESRAAYSYQSSSDPRLHFGLGAATSARSVVVTWPGGEREGFGDLAADRQHVLVRGGGS